MVDDHESDIIWKFWSLGQNLKKNFKNSKKIRTGNRVGRFWQYQQTWQMPTHNFDNTKDIFGNTSRISFELLLVQIKSWMMSRFGVRSHYRGYFSTYKFNSCQKGDIWIPRIFVSKRRYILGSLEKFVPKIKRCYLGPSENLYQKGDIWVSRKICVKKISLWGMRHLG